MGSAATTRASPRFRGWAALSVLVVAVSTLGCGRSSSPSTPAGGSATSPAESGPDSESGSGAIAPSPELPIDAPRPQAFEVAWAVWGDKERTSVLDATEFVRAALLDDGTLAWDDAAINQAVGDPNPGRPGWLTIGLKSPTRTIIIGLTDNSSISLTVPPASLAPWGSDRRWPAGELDRARRLIAPAAAESGLIWARWGNDGEGGGWVSATNAIDQQLTSGDTIANRTAGMPVERRPNNFRRKSLRLLLAFDGQPISLLLRDSSFIATAPTPERFARTGLPQPTGLAPPMPEPLGQTIITATLADAGDIAFTLPSADGEHVYALERHGTRLLKVRADTMLIEAELSGLDPVYACMATSADGMTLYLAGAPGVGGAGLLAEVDLGTLTLRRPPIIIRCEPLALSELDAENLLAFDRSGAIARIDLPSGVVLTEFDVRSDSPAGRFHPDHRRFLLAQAGQIECFTFDPERGEAVPPVHTRGSSGLRASGGFSFLDGGGYLLTRAGTLARVGQNVNRMVMGTAMLPVNSGGALSRELGVLAIGTPGGLRVVSWPGLRPLAEGLCDGLLTDMSVYDAGRTIVARLLPDGQLGPRGEVAGTAEATLVSIDLAGLVPSWFAPEPGDAVAQDAPAPLARRLPLAADITALVMPAYGEWLYALDATEGVALRIDPGTLDVVARSAPLPFSCTLLAVDPAGLRLVVAGSGAPASWAGTDHRGWVLALDPLTLTPVGAQVDFPAQISSLAVNREGHALVVAQGEYQASVLQIDLAQGLEIGRLEGVAENATVTHVPAVRTLLVNWYNNFLLHTYWIPPDETVDSAVPMSPLTGETAGGGVWVVREGRYAVRSDGSVLRLAQRRNPDAIGALGPLWGGAGANGVLVVCTKDKTLECRSLPDLALMGRVQLDVPLTNLCYDAAGRRVYGVLRSGGTDEGGGPAAAAGDVVSIDLDALGVPR